MVFIFCDSSYPGCKGFLSGYKWVKNGYDEFCLSSKALEFSDDTVKFFRSKKDAQDFINDNYTPWTNDSFIPKDLKILTMSHLYECSRKIFASNLKAKQFFGGS